VPFLYASSKVARQMAKKISLLLSRETRLSLDMESKTYLGLRSARQLSASFIE